MRRDPRRAEAIVAGAGWWFQLDREQTPLEALAGCAERGHGGLDGQFLVVSFDKATGRVTAAGDRLGLFPVYVAEGREMVLIGSSATVLAAALGRGLDRQALPALFVGDAIRPPRSAFEGVRRLGMGEEVRAAAGRMTIERVWSPFVAPRSRRLDDAVDEASTILARTGAAIQRQWPRWVADLTAGLDSRLVVAAMAAHGPVSATVSGPADSDDVRIAADIARAFGWPLHRYTLPPDWAERRWALLRRGIALADGELPGAAVERVVEAKQWLAASFDASLSGGAGELLRDFFWQQEMLTIGRTARVDVERLLRYRFFFGASRDAGLLPPGWRAAYEADQAAQIRALLAPAPDALNTAKLDAIYLWKSAGHIGRYQGVTLALMAAPMLLATPALVELALALPWQLRRHGQFERALLTRLHPQLAALPTWYGGSARPLGLRRPGDLARYAVGAARKGLRKLGEVTLPARLRRDATVRRDAPADRALVGALARERWLDADTLRTRELYDGDALRRLLQQIRGGDLYHLGSLHAVITAEWLARITAGANHRRVVACVARDRLTSPNAANSAILDQRNLVLESGDENLVVRWAADHIELVEQRIADQQAQ